MLCRVFNNKVVANNHDNFAPKGNIVASVPPGTGVMILANDEVEVFDNTIEKNQTGGLSIISLSLHRSERSRTRSSTHTARRSTFTTTASRATAANRAGRLARC